jgi:hypothetical protein
MEILKWLRWLATREEGIAAAKGIFQPFAVIGCVGAIFFLPWIIGVVALALLRHQYASLNGPVQGYISFTILVLAYAYGLAMAVKSFKNRPRT